MRELVIVLHVFATILMALSGLYGPAILFGLATVMWIIVYANEGY